MLRQASCSRYLSQARRLPLRMLHLPSHPSAAGELFSDSLAFPSPVSSSDAMLRDGQGQLRYHYAIINLAAVPEVCSLGVAAVATRWCELSLLA